jgi:hypothetical protein
MPESGSNSSETNPLRPPPAIPDHELLRRIGRGSYGEVWLARNHTGTLRAIKIIHRAAFDDDRPYEREFTGLKHFEPLSREHEGLVDILQLGRNDAEGWFYSIMELADGVETETGDGVMAKERGGGGIETQHSTTPTLQGLDSYRPLTLESRIRAEGRLPVQECVRIAAKLAGALRFLHERGLVHRDIKPSNIVFVGGVPKLADVGLVARAESARTFVGTEGFVPPEGPGTSSADLYSLGKCLYEMAMGKDRQAFPSPPTQLDELPDRAELLELNEVITRACDPSPARRYTSAALLKDLGRLATGGSIRGARRLRRVGWTAGALVGITIVVTLLVAREGLVLEHEFELPPRASVGPQSIVDLEGNGVIRVLSTEPTGQLNLYAPDGSLVASGRAGDGGVDVTRLDLVVPVEPGAPQRVLVSWQTRATNGISSFNSRLQERVGHRLTALHVRYADRDETESSGGWLSAIALRPATNDQPPELLTSLTTGFRLWPRELRCYNATNLALRWTLPFAAPPGLGVPIHDPRLGGGIAWIIGTGAPGNGATMPDGESDKETLLRALDTQGRQIWRLRTGGAYMDCRPLVVSLPEGNSLFALVRRDTGIYWQSGKALAPSGRVIRVNAAGQVVATYPAPEGVEFRSLQAGDLDGDTRPELLVTDGQGRLHVLGSDLVSKQVIPITPTPPPDRFVSLSLTAPADLDGDGAPELAFLSCEVEFISGQDVRGTREINEREYHHATLTVFDRSLRRRAKLKLDPNPTTFEWQFTVTPPGRDGTRQIAIIGAKAVRFYRYAP